LKNFDTFVDSYKRLNSLAFEADKRFYILLNTLNNFCNTIEEVTEDNVRMSIIEWYSNTTVTSTDIIQVKSKYYNAPAFSDIAISINVDNTQNYNMAKGVCFGKIRLKINY
jgi:hypothetical protein